MSKITFKVVNDKNVDYLRELCNSLMTFQASEASIHKEILSSMDYDTRLKVEYENTERKFMIVAYDDDLPVGFSYASISNLNEESVSQLPPWAQSFGGLGFYPAEYSMPRTIGTFKLLYVDSNYRGLQIGKKLSSEVMKWLYSNKDVDDLWVYVSNGNEIVGKLYEKLGFKYSHSVFNGFITAYSVQVKD